MPTRRHRHRLLALFALFGLLFQQVAMATYACPLVSAIAAAEAAASPPCHAAHASDKARCQQHCRPAAQSVDHAPMPSVPPALLPATTWLRAAPVDLRLSEVATGAIEARATAPPLTVRDCTFQI
jgi:hypothetical protein